MADQPIPISSANTRITGYINFMTDLGVDMTKQTQNVTFNATTLKHWLDGVVPFANQLRICLGVYPTGHAQEGRMTVILWPHNNGQPAKDGNNNNIEPFNEGQGLP